MYIYRTWGVSVIKMTINDRQRLTHWGRVMHMCVGNLTIIGSDKCLLPYLHQTIIWTNTAILQIRTCCNIVNLTLRNGGSEILNEIYTTSLKKMQLKLSSEKRWPFLSRPQCVDAVKVSTITSVNFALRVSLRHWHDGLSLGHLQSMGWSRVDGILCRPLAQS